jgi:subfamily B ATP-binding cassette protein MsbA
MFLRPFLKYFRPFRWRLGLAVLGMVVVGGLSAAPLLIARETIRVLLYNNPALAEELEAGGQLSAEKRRLLKELLATQGTAVAQTDDTAAAADAPAPETATQESLLRRADAWLARRTGVVWTGPRDRIAGVVAGFKEWYGGYAAISPLHALGFLVAMLVALIVLKGLAEFTSKYHLAFSFFHTNLTIREDIFLNVLRQDYLFFSRHSAGYLYSRINSDVKELKGILEGLMSDGIQQPITLVTMFSILMFLSWQLTLGVMLILPVIGGLLYYFARVLRKNTRKQKEKSDELSSSLTESLSNIRLVKAFGTEKLEIAKFHERSMALFRYIMARRLVKFGSSPLMELLGSLAVGGVILFGGWMILSTPPRMKFEDYIIYLFTLSRFYGPIKKLASLTNKYQIARVSCERMIEMMGLRPKLGDNPDGARFERVREAIEFHNVGFSYGKESVLKNVSLRVPAGSRVAFAGPSGSGKTTLINLLVRLFDPREGRIVVDGMDLREYRLRDWREHLAIVTQDTYLFEDTIANNIAYGSATVDRPRIEAAARAANAHEFIMDFAGARGYDTPVGPVGSRLSGGQRQRIAIARAIYRDPKVLILDEATSALDSQSQFLVQEALGRLMEGRTTFVIAHRISTIRDVDCIYVLGGGGGIAESGTHDDLIAQGGLYAALATHTGRPSSLLPDVQPHAVGARDALGDDGVNL